ncbi:MAG: class I SAM-dependent methyltransferase, partial [Gammaproteobacteria bacterium]
AKSLKERERNSWAAAAAGWRRQDALLRKGAAPVTARMLERAGIRAGHRVLDIASGTGEPALSAAALTGDSGCVIGTDLVEEMLAFAREKAQQAGLGNIEFRCVDGELLALEAATFDAVTNRWGLMFMPEPKACLAAAHAALKPGGRIVLACWTTPDQNPFVGLIMETLADYMAIPQPPPGTPGIFAFADPERLQSVLESAGFDAIELETLEVDVIEVADGRCYWEVMSDLAAPVMLLVRQLDPATRAAFIEDVIARADTLKQDDSLRMRGTTWIASASK